MLHVFFSHFILRDEPPSVIFNSTSIYLGYFLIFLYYFYIFWSIKLHFLSEVKLTENKYSKEALPSPFLYVSIPLGDIFSFLECMVIQTKGKDLFIIMSGGRWGTI